MRIATLARLCVIALLAALLPVIAAAPASATLTAGDVNFLVSNQPGKVSVRGWAIDPDEPTRPVTVHVYVGGYGMNIGEAASYRPDVGAAYPGYGDYHGFETTFDVPVVGDLAWEVYGIDTQGGPPTLIETGRVTIADPSPTGNFEATSSPGHRQISVAGWAGDPNAPSASVEVWAYVGGTYDNPAAEKHVLATGVARADVASATGYGPNAGFGSTFSTAKTGAQTVHLYAINRPGTPGANKYLGNRSVTVFVDSTAPDTTITSAPTVATPLDVIRVTYSSSEANSTFGCRWDSAAFDTCSGASTTSLPPGEHTFQVRATDAAGNTDATPASAVVVVSNYATQPLPVDDRAIKLDAVKKKSKLRINVDPDFATDNYRVTIQRKTGKKWVKARKVRTRGTDAVVVVNLPRGKYRVVLPKRDLDPAITSTAVRLKR